jgi:hypothetical protein
MIRLSRLVHSVHSECKQAGAGSLEIHFYPLPVFLFVMAINESPLLHIRCISFQTPQLFNQISVLHLKPDETWLILFFEQNSPWW